MTTVQCAPGSDGGADRGEGSAADGTADRGADRCADERLRRRLERLIGIAATEGNTLVPLRNGDEIFPAMLESVRAAEHTIDMMTFVYWRGDIAREFAEALADRARAGVRVRVLLDGFGSRPIEQGLLGMMEDAGAQVAWFRKPARASLFKQNHRCHRKVLIVDEQIGYTGGVGIAEEWCGDARNPGEWRDTHVRLEGPAVDGLAAAFTQNWAECHDGRLTGEGDRFVKHPVQRGDAVVQVVRGSASVGWTDMETLMRVVLESAQERIRITTAYFAPDEYFIELLCATARRGVELDILLPGPHTDKRVCQLAGQRFYEQLTSCGVRLWHYQPTMMHAKVVTVDRTAALVGSTNFNRRSLGHDEEVMLAVLDESFTATLDAHFDEDLRCSERIAQRRWKRRHILQRARETAVAPIRRFL